MNRRQFLGQMIGGIALGAAARSWPFRIYSFASEPIAPHPISLLSTMDVEIERVFINGHALYRVIGYPYGSGITEISEFRESVNLIDFSRC